MQDFGAVEAVEFRCRSDAVRTDVFGVEEIADLKISRQMLREGDFVEAVACGADDGADLLFAVSESMEFRDPVVKNHPGKCLIDAVVDVVEDFAVPARFSDDF